MSHPFLGEEKIVQNGQTEPRLAVGYPKMYVIQREAKFVRSIKHIKKKIRQMTNFLL